LKQSGCILPQKCICGENNFHCCHIYNKRPKRETDFKIGEYYREIWQCKTCGHFLSKTKISLEELYSGDYASMTYGNIDDIRNNFHRIMALDPNCSDNIGRVSNLKEFASNYFKNKEKIDILDIGSGLGVFLAQIKLQTEWNCTAIEPDPQMAKHISGHLMIPTYNDDFRNIDFDAKFDIITLNKVLEHIEDPSDLLASCTKYLKHGGFVYLEVPDGKSAAQDSLGFGREEFFLEHHHAFSLNSTKKMVEKAGFELIEIERLKEPSTKYTIRAFIRN
jgi:2-polyprenyl-3-methyl-5-hydroxy-6-metoxy-1,4-benzoquinol methylase